MKFSGRLQIEADPVEWLKTDLSLAQGRVELTSGNEVLGSWSMSQVKAERIEGDRFELLLGDDRALFAADDALAFSYEAMPHLTKRHILTGPTGLRGRIRNSLRNNERHPTEHKSEKPAQFAQQNVAPTAKGSPESINHPVARRLRDLIEAAAQEQSNRESSLFEPVMNGSRGMTHPSPEVEHTEDYPMREEDSDFEVAPVEPLYEYEAELVEAETVPEDWSNPSDWAEAVPAEAEPGPPAWPAASTESEFTDLLGTSPPQPNSIRLDLVPAFARASPRDDEPEDWVMVALEGLLAEVRKGSMTPAQVGAITDLVQAVTDLVAARRGSNPS